MKNFQQNLLILITLSLCLLCAYQWHDQTRQREVVDGLNKLLSQKLASIQEYTNSIHTMDVEIAQMDGHLGELQATLKTNEQLIVSQKREITRLDLVNQSLTNQLAQYANAVSEYQSKLKEAFEAIQKQNDALKQLVKERDDFVQKLNDSVKDRNQVVSQYNQLVEQVSKMQKGKQ